MAKYPTHLLKLIEVLKKLPGIGNKSAERFAFEMLKWPETHLREMAKTISDIPLLLISCPQCGSLMNADACLFCNNGIRDQTSLCIVASSRDVFSVEATGEYYGLYHVLGGLLSPITGVGPDQLNMSNLKKRIETLEIKEIVIALDATLEGDTTALYLKEELQNFPLRISRPAFGLPMGSSLEYVDGGTLARALSLRRDF